MARVLIACEYSGVMRDAFIAAGHEALSCDLLPAERGGPHYQGDLFEIVRDGWDLVIAHPPCTYLTVSGNRWFNVERYGAAALARAEAREAAVGFVERLLALPVPYIAVENPVGVLSSRIGKPQMIVQPWWFGHGEIKATCFWTRGGLPVLQPTQIVEGREARVWRMGPSAERWRERSRTLPGLAAACAAQWGGWVEQQLAAPSGVRVA